MSRVDSAFKDPRTARALAERIGKLVVENGLDQIRFMEVCGTHTMSIHRNGIPSMLPQQVRTISGPGCPVCVTPNGYLDAAIEIGRRYYPILTTFGDMLKVPGSRSTLEREKAGGLDVRMVYSPLDALRLAKEHSDRQVVFLGVGFETTAPTIGACVSKARRDKLDNFSVLAAHKLIPPALHALLDAGDTNVSGFILPGHVSAILGVEPYREVAEKRGAPCVIAGFEPVDVLEGVLRLLNQMIAGSAEVEIQYSRCVRPDGNPTARALMDEVFEVADTEWRGLGVIPRSGLEISKAYAEFDAAWKLPVEIPPPVEPRGCRCGDVLRGVIQPSECPLFGRTCLPANPVGPCMVSSEGACAAHYKYDFA